MKKILEKLIARQGLTQEEVYVIMKRHLTGEFSDAQISGFLIALQMKGPRSGEIAGFAKAMCEKMTPVPITTDAIDMCGTGGDAMGTFNISTAASFVVAGAGVPVAKHGTQSMSSKSGSADVLKELGIDINLPPEKVALCVDEIGMGFMYAPKLHPALERTARITKSLAVRTVIDILAPMCNPAHVKRQVLGVYDSTLTDKMAKVLKKMGAKEAYLVNGHDGMDEITTTSSTKITHLKQSGEIESTVFSPSDFGLDTASLEDLQGGTPDYNAKIILDILNDSKGKKRDIVLFNAAAGIKIGGKTDTIETGLKLAEESISCGAAKDVLDRLSEVH